LGLKKLKQKAHFFEGNAKMNPDNFEEKSYEEETES
jgi:hypothetical protein